MVSGTYAYAAWRAAQHRAEVRYAGPAQVISRAVRDHPGDARATLCREPGGLTAPSIGPCQALLLFAGIPAAKLPVRSPAHGRISHDRNATAPTPALRRKCA